MTDWEIIGGEIPTWQLLLTIHVLNTTRALLTIQPFLPEYFTKDSLLPSHKDA